jgi:tight adherence protein B
MTVLTILALATPSKIVFAGLLAAAVLAFALALIFMSGPNQRGSIEERLGELAPAPADEVDEFNPNARPDQVFAETAVLKRIVGLTGRLADRAGLLSRTEDALEGADLPLRPPEALFFYFSSVFVVALLGIMLFPPGLALILIVAATILPVAWLHRRRKKRLRVFQTQLPSTLNLLSGSMRAGFSFAQGLESVANEATQPTRRELQRVFTESRLGRPIEDALEDSAQRMTSVDLMWAVMAIRIQREVGGNLSELLLNVAATLREREYLRRQVAVLSAEGRLSAFILGGLPIFFFGYLFLIRPTYLHPMLVSPIGWGMLGAACVMMLVGFVWLKKVVKVEV